MPVEEKFKFVRERRKTIDDREQYCVEIDARIAKFGETLNEIKTNRELRKEHIPCNVQDAK